MKKVAIFIIIVLVISASFFLMKDKIWYYVQKDKFEKKGEITEQFMDYVIKEQSDTALKLMAKDADEKGKSASAEKIYMHIFDKYIREKSPDMTLEVFATEIDKAKHKELVSKIYREMLLRQNANIEYVLARNNIPIEERIEMVRNFVKYFRIINAFDTSLDLLQNLATRVTTKEEIMEIYPILIDYRMRKGGIQDKEIIEIMRKDLKGRLSEPEIKKMFAKP